MAGSERYVALLRGVNLGPRNKVAMADLRATCESVGCTDVTTYIQSGNVVLSSRRTAAGLRTTLERAIADQLGVSSTVVVRTRAQLARVLQANPFPRADPKELHVGFLAEPPARRAAASLADVSFPPDEFELRGTELYFRYPNGMGRSKLAAFPFDRRLDVPVTVRNWRTVTKLHELSA
ncbi:MAG TPA: DUF1697 domain-containing protein [Gaiellaceae bacterium]|nr:DUF1697 domain-containing protein [Gaiellaceae bacterium]